MNQDISSLKEAEKASFLDEKEPCNTPASGSWFPGVILILLGTIFFFTTTTGWTLENWWALFILIPAVANFGHAWQQWQHNGRFSNSVRSSFTAGCVFTLVAVAFLLELDWGLIWPSILIVFGVSALLNGLSR